MKEIDNRGSNFYVALYWASCLADKDSSWLPLAKALKDAEDQILKELVDCQGPSVDIGGYYHPNPEKAESAMRPSKVFNNLMDNMESVL